ncbi:type II toxin-antitoxin system RelE family toxin [Dyadobacter frigoris]|uniref:Type II toxin-antitoxin system RelE/ParE family toxin n=1 Tax=Dyadobacter frigoris TaxID=2576211 RepID=A0A4U6CVE7_9BACT|nr:type II toxin-antitoxin system RelE/ParE family toxin [Dyadobacter frigoris]TKT88730.1 type II toxin-antitoxin system RelE/ParE family toxin [Dyadobacter frigoris]GLU53922.1 toxin RelE [Dyadobacter frigoris]
MEIEIRSSFLKELKKLPSDIQISVYATLKTLREAQSLESSDVDYKKMQGQKKGGNYYRIRLGQWRIGIEYINPEIIAITVLSRGNIYKHFPPGKN